MKRIKDWFLDIAVWMIRRRYNSTVILGGNMSETDKIDIDEEHEAEVIGLDAMSHVQGEFHTVQEMFAVLFHERPEFLAEIIIPAIKASRNKRRFEVPVEDKKSAKKPERTVN